MKLKEKLAAEYILDSELCGKEQGYSFFHGYLAIYLAGFEKARELIAGEFQDQSDWAFEGFNQGDATIPECAYATEIFSHLAPRINRIGEFEAPSEGEK